MVGEQPQAQPPRPLISHEAVAPTLTQHWDSGEGIERHRHDQHQLIYVSTGVLALTTERCRWVGSRERGVWVPAGLWHGHRFYGRTVFHTLGFAVDETPLPGAAPTIVAASDLARELIIAAADWQLPTSEARRIRAVQADQLQRGRTEPLIVPTARDDRLAAACSAVETDLSQPRTIGWLARYAGASERTLARLFRTELGMTYPQWRTTVRVFHAMTLLSTGVSVTQTAHACGWATPSAFIDTFTRALGQTSGSYRGRQ